MAGPRPKEPLEARLVVTPKPVSFLGEVDPIRGVLKRPGGLHLRDSIMVFPQSRGSTVGSYVVYALSFYKNAPRAMVVENAEPLLITGCVIGEIPLFRFEEKPDYALLEKCGRGAIVEKNPGDFMFTCREQ